MRVTSYMVVGWVTTSTRLNSRRNRSIMISRWSIPKKPQRNPLPITPDDSSSYDRDESESRNFSSDCLSIKRSSCDSGYTLAHITGVGLEYPCKGDAEFLIDVIVSPTDAIPGFLIPVTM